MDSQLLEGMDKEVRLVAASVEDAHEEFIRAKNRTAEAARALSLTPHDKLLRLQHHHAKMREKCADDHRLNTELLLRRTWQSRQDMAEEMKGAGERPALPAQRAGISAPYSLVCCTMVCGQCTASHDCVMRVEKESGQSITNCGTLAVAAILVRLKRSCSS